MPHRIETPLGERELAGPNGGILCFDKMAACGVEEAIWIVMTQSAGHKVLQALNDPPEGAPRVEKTYASTTPPQQFRIETQGLTAIYPAAWLRDSLAAEE